MQHVRLRLSWAATLPTARLGMAAQWGGTASFRCTIPNRNGTFANPQVSIRSSPSFLEPRSSWWTSTDASFALRSILDSQKSVTELFIGTPTQGGRDRLPYRVSYCCPTWAAMAEVSNACLM